MNRALVLPLFGLLFGLLLPAASVAQPAAKPGFDTATAAAVWGAALAYIAPRALSVVSLSQMTVWGLNGLTALDPDINTTLQNGRLTLTGPAQMLLALAAPAPADAAAWGQAAAAIAAAAYNASPALQQAGTQGLISSFFDELFNHFDPYSRYEPPLQAAQEQLMVTGLAGAGLTLIRQGNGVMIGAVAADGPAAQAGLVPGTTVLSVDGRPAYAGGLAALNNALNGLAGTITTLRLADPANPGPPTPVTLTRALIPPQTVAAFGFTPASAAVIGLRIASFNVGTSGNFAAALVAAMAAQPDAQNVVLDLRGNRGGNLRQAVLVADSLLPSGRIAEAQGRDPDADQVFTAEGTDLTGGMRLVVLVDGQTASAAEILAAALADNRRAVVIGAATLGKGLVQTLTSLPDGGELYVTWSRVLAPRGWPLQSLGVIPQICTSLDTDALSAELAALRHGHDLLAPVLRASRAARAPLPINELLTLRNACPAAIGGDLDTTAALAVLASPAAYQAALLP